MSAWHQFILLCVFLTVVSCFDDLIPDASASSDCEPGAVHVHEGCIECPHGTFSNQQENKCEPCPLNTYSDTSGATTCQPCIPPLKTLQVASTKCTEVCELPNVYNAVKEKEFLALGDSLRIWCDDGYTRNGSSFFLMSCPLDKPNTVYFCSKLDILYVEEELNQESILVCNVTSEIDVSYSISWISDGNPIQDNEVFTISRVSSHSSKLKVNTEKIESTAYFIKCRAQFEDHPIFEESQELLIYSTRSGVSEHGALSKWSRDSLDVYCFAAVNPNDIVTITWSRNNQDIPHVLRETENNLEKVHLRKKDLAMSDNGTYTCTVTYSDVVSRRVRMSRSHSVAILVQGFLAHPHNSTSFLKRGVGHTATIGCEAYTASPAVITWWSHDQQVEGADNIYIEYSEFPSPDGIIYGYLTYDGNTTTSAKEFYCVLEAGGSTMRSTTSTVQFLGVIQGPGNQTIFDDSILKLSCVVKRSLQIDPWVRWINTSTADEKPIDEKYTFPDTASDTSLTSYMLISRPSVYESGAYYCEVNYPHYGENVNSDTAYVTVLNSRDD